MGPGSFAFDLGSISLMLGNWKRGNRIMTREISLRTYSIGQCSLGRRVCNVVEADGGPIKNDGTSFESNDTSFTNAIKFAAWGK